MAEEKEEFKSEITTLEDGTPWKSWDDLGLSCETESDYIEWKRLGAPNNPQSLCGVLRIQPGHKLRYHRHKPAELYLPKKGRQFPDARYHNYFCPFVTNEQGRIGHHMYWRLVTTRRARPLS